MSARIKDLVITLARAAEGAREEHAAATDLALRRFGDAMGRAVASGLDPRRVPGLVGLIEMARRREAEQLAAQIATGPKP